MDFNPSTWGTVGQWASAVITGSAFFATFYVIRRDARIRRRHQARRVAFYTKTGTQTPAHETTSFYIRNGSDEPIFDVFFYFHEGSASEIGSTTVLHPGEETLYVGQNTPRVSFCDNDRVLWQKDIEGNLRRRKPKYSNVYRTHTRRLRKSAASNERRRVAAK